jgi:hypothetical protein
MPNHSLDYSGERVEVFCLLLLCFFDTDYHEVALDSLELVILLP